MVRMENFALAITVYVFFAIPCGLLCAITWIRHRKSIRLDWADWFLLVLPWAIWIGLVVGGYREKSLSNTVESVVLGIATGLFFVARSWSVRLTRRPQSQLALASLVASSLAAVAIWVLVPALPE